MKWGNYIRKMNKLNTCHQYNYLWDDTNYWVYNAPPSHSSFKINDFENRNRFKVIPKLCFLGFVPLPWVSKCYPFIFSGGLWDEKRFQLWKRQHKSASSCDCTVTSSQQNLHLPKRQPGSPSCLCPRVDADVLLVIGLIREFIQLKSNFIKRWVLVLQLSCHIHRALHKQASVNKQL